MVGNIVITDTLDPFFILGLPAGGTTGQVLKKKSNANFDTEWGGGATPVDKTYADLLAMKTGATLVVGQTYKITDFRTYHLIPNTATYFTGATEPLIVMAIDINKLSVLAFSASFPDDIIYYELISSSLYDPGVSFDRGRIIRRIDTLANIDWPEDFRGMNYRRWETALGAADYTSYTDTGFGYRDFYPFSARTPDKDFCHDISCGIPSDYTGQFVVNNVFICPGNPATNAGVHLGFDCINNTFGTYGSSGVVSIQTGDTFSGNIIGGGCANIIFGNSCSGNILRMCTNVTIGTTCSSINIGSESPATRVRIGNGAGPVYIGGGNDFEIGNEAYAITINGACFHVTIGANGSTITIGSGCQRIELGNSVQDFTIGTNCRSIKIETDVVTGSVGNDCEDILMEPGCTFNYIGDANSQVACRLNSNGNETGARCHAIEFGIYARSITVNADCSYIQFKMGSNTCSIGANSSLITIGENVACTIGANCYGITIGNITQNSQWYPSPLVISNNFGSGELSRGNSTLAMDVDFGDSNDVAAIGFGGGYVDGRVIGVWRSITTSGMSAFLNVEMNCRIIQTAASTTLTLSGTVFEDVSLHGQFLYVGDIVLNGDYGDWCDFYVKQITNGNGTFKVLVPAARSIYGG